MSPADLTPDLEAIKASVRAHGLVEVFSAVWACMKADEAEAVHCEAMASTAQPGQDLPWLASAARRWERVCLWARVDRDLTLWAIAEGLT